MRTRRHRISASDAATKPVRLRAWPYALAALGAILGVFHAYGPALGGPFLFDDWTLPFNYPGIDRAPLWAWLAGVRPVLMFSYWVNYALSRQETFSYHAVNVLIHLLNSALVFLVLRRLLRLSPAGDRRRELLAAFAAAVFLLHPLQTESVAYVAGRSESLSALFVLAALAVFLYRSGAGVSWRVSLTILALFAAGAGTKEHVAAMLPALLLLFDWLHSPDGLRTAVRSNWRLYLPLGFLTAGGAAYVYFVLLGSPSVGFTLEEYGWRQYFYTQCRVLLSYVRLFFVPFGQNFDHDVAVSRTLFDHGAVLAGAVLLAAIGVAVHLRRRYPLAAIGLLFFLAVLAPTSSVIPLIDPMAERRLYLAAVGLLLIVLEALTRVRLRPAPVAGLCCALLVFAGALTWRRAQVYSEAIGFWKDVIAKSPRKTRPYPHLAYSYLLAKRCQQGVRDLEQIAPHMPRDYYILVNWALVYDCVNQPQQALEKLEEAAVLNASGEVYGLMGMVLRKLGRWTDAREAFERALRLDPHSEWNYLYRGDLHAATQRLDAALEDYRHAFTLNPANPVARAALTALELHLRSFHDANGWDHSSGQ